MVIEPRYFTNQLADALIPADYCFSVVVGEISEYKTGGI